MADDLDSDSAAATREPGDAPVPGDDPPQPIGPAACLNCGTALTGPHCGQCGQPAHIHRTLSALWHDLLHGVLHLEGRIWRTLPLLVWRPGDLTRRYVAGERARFVSPVALFLFAVFLMFATFNLVGGPFEAGDMEELRSRRAGVVKALEMEKEALQRLEKGLREERRIGHADHAARMAKGAAETRRVIAALESIPKPRRAGPEVRRSAGQKWLATMGEKVAADPPLVLYKIQNNAYKLSWLLIPVSLPFLWLLFPFRRRFPMYDHAVFVTHSLSFATLLLVTLSLAAVIVGRGGWAEIAIAAIMPVHMYRHLRGAYGLTRLNALLRTALLAAFAAMTLILFVLLLLALVVGG